MNLELDVKKAVKVKFWGTRGSLGKPGRDTVRYGGNTACVQVTSPNGSLVVIDLGTGVHDLGRDLLSKASGPLNGTILVSHTHWDHIQGFPFFAPAFIPGSTWNLYGPGGVGLSLQKALSGQMEHTYCPIHLEQMPSKLKFHDLVQGYIEIDDIQITTYYLNHPALALAYRLKMGNITVIYACDHEPYSRCDGSTEIHPLDQVHADFVEGADLVIHDCQFTDKEYPSRRGWGHSTFEYVMELGQMANVKKMAITHHDPQRTDDQLDVLIKGYRQQLKERSASLDLFGAVEGTTIEFETIITPPAERPAEIITADKETLAHREALVFVSVADPAWKKLIDESLTDQHISGVCINDPDTIASLAKSDPPTLIILQDVPDDAVTRHTELKKSDPQLKEVPVIIIGKKERVDDARWLRAPFSSQYAGALIQSSLMKSPLRWTQAPVPLDEDVRLSKLNRLALSKEAEERFDCYTRLAAALSDVSTSLITIIDRDHQWFKSCLCGGLPSETSKDLSFCAHAILSHKPLIVPDSLLDDRFADNPLVVGMPRIRFYAGFPLSLEGTGSCIGTLCLLDTRPRLLNNRVIESLVDLAAQLEKEITRAA